MTKSEYALYLQSAHWKTLRAEVLNEIETCQRCDLPRWLSEIAYDQDLHLHHLSYANLGNEPWVDLEVLCPRCHDLETFGRSDRRKLKSFKCALCRYTHWNPRSEYCTFCHELICEPHLYFITNRPHPDHDILVGQRLIHQVKGWLEDDGSQGGEL